MAIIQIKRAAERKLIELSPSFPTAWESVTFNPPDGLYQRVQFTIQAPDDPVLGTGFHRERMQMQVFVVGNANKGTSEVLERIELVRNHFAKGLVLDEDGIKIHVLTTPQITGSSIASERVICAVIIKLVAEVYSY
jgi:tRNA/tmRNA/rRNA uracil-C5-methylase (TrmA/RlmC/RlmD family)